MNELRQAINDVREAVKRLGELKELNSIFAGLDSYEIEKELNFLEGYITCLQIHGKHAENN